MLTPKEVGELGSTMLERFVEEVHCNSTEDIANAVMSLASLCSLALIGVCGKEDATARMEGVLANFMRTTAEKVNVELVPRSEGSVH